MVNQMTAFANTVNPARIPAGKLKELSASLDRSGRIALVDDEGHRTELPEDIVHHLEHVCHLLEEQRAVVVLPDDEIFTVKTAANYLAVSTKHLGELLETRKIPYQIRDGESCILLRDLLVYEQRWDDERRAILDRLTEELDRAGVYDSSYQAR
jgi:hypothetical protein